MMSQLGISKSTRVPLQFTIYAFSVSLLPFLTLLRRHLHTSVGATIAVAFCTVRISDERESPTSSRIYDAV